MNSYSAILIFAFSINTIYSFPSPYDRKVPRDYEPPFPYDEQVPVIRRNPLPLFKSIPFDQGQFDFPFRPSIYDLQPRYPQWGGFDDVFRNMEETIRKLKEDLDRAIVIPGTGINATPTKNETTSKTEVIDGEVYQVNRTVLTAGDPEHGEVVKVLVTVRKIEDPSTNPEGADTPKILPPIPEGPETPEVSPVNPEGPETPEISPPNPERPVEPVPSVPETLTPERPDIVIPENPNPEASSPSSPPVSNSPSVHRRHEMEGENEIPIRIRKYEEDGRINKGEVDDNMLSNEIDSNRISNVISLRDDTMVNDRISDLQHKSGLVMVDPDAELIDTNKLLINNDKYAVSA